MFIISNSSLITSINHNSKQVLNAKINDLLTIFINDMHRSIPKYQQNFIRLAYDFQNITGRSWCNEDFPRMSKDYFRQMRFQLAQIITQTIPGRPGFYKLNHTHIDESLTIKDTGLPINSIDHELDLLMFRCKQQPPTFHNIRLHTMTDLYYKLPDTFSINKHNKSYSFPVTVDLKFPIIVNVSKLKMFVMIKCPPRGIPFDTAGFNELILLVGKLLHNIRLQTDEEFQYEPIGDWILSNYDFAKDLKIDSQYHKHTINDLQNQSKYYLKRYEGQNHLRYENLVTSTKTINEIQQEFK